MTPMQSMGSFSLARVVALAKTKRCSLSWASSSSGSVNTCRRGIVLQSVLRRSSFLLDFISVSFFINADLLQLNFMFLQPLRFVTLISPGLLIRLPLSSFCSVKQHYTEQPFKPKDLVQSTKKYLRSLNIKEPSIIIQSVSQQFQLFQTEAVPFSYDIYEECCVCLVQIQKKVHLSDILRAMHLGHKHQIAFEFFWSHFQNEIHHRLKKELSPFVEQYYENIDEQFQGMLSTFQANKMDLFGYLTPEALEQQMQAQSSDVPNELGKTEQGKTELGKTELGKTEQGMTEISRVVELTPKQKLIRKSKKIKNFSLTKMIEISDLLVWKNCQNRELLSLLLDAITIKLAECTDILSTWVLAHLRLLMHTCQTSMAIYANNKRKYTARSIKNIYKLQTHYFHEHFIQLEATLPQFTNEQLYQLLDVYTYFPIKRRLIRRTIGERIALQVERRQLIGEPILKTLMSLNHKDPKMNAHFRVLMKLPYIPPTQQIAQNNPQQTNPQIGSTVEDTASSEVLQERKQ